MPASRRNPSLFLTFLLAVVCNAVPCILQAEAAEDLGDAARGLARKIVASLRGHEGVALTVRNLSSLAANEVSEVRHALEAELRSRGVRLVGEPEAGGSVRVTLSENLQGYVFVAELRQGEAQEVVMVALERRAGATRPGNVGAPALEIRKELVWEQEEPILDFALVDISGETARGLLVLEPTKVAFYRKSSGSAEPAYRLWQERPVATFRPWPRDLRGRLVVRGDVTSAYLPGVECFGKSAEDFSFDCHESDGPWPMHAGEEERGQAHLAAGRNFFDEWLSREPGEHKPAPFFSAAGIGAGGATHWIFTGVDGRARLYDEGGDELATFSGWGRELASVRSDCGSGWQLLVTRPGDAAEADAIQAYEIVEREAVAVGAPVEFPGPVRSLWPAENGKAVMAVVQNLRTGRHEAFGLAISCSR